MTKQILRAFSNERKRKTETDIQKCVIDKANIAKKEKQKTKHNSKLKTVLLLKLIRKGGGGGEEGVTDTDTDRA